MLYFLFIWAILLSTSYILGLSFGTFTRLPSIRFGDRFFLYVWLGLVLLAILFLAIALWQPLSLSVGFSFCLLIIGGGLLSFPQARKEITKIKSFCQHHIWLSLVSILVIGCASAWVTQQVQWIESKFYHFQAVRWLSEAGVVKGLVLVLKNLGIVSSWFALIAPWNGGAIDFRAGAVVNGLIVALCLVHGLLILYRICLNREERSDWFIGCFYFLLLLWAVISDEFQFIIVSPSPDLPIVLLIGLFCWSLLVIAESEEESANLIPIASIPLILAIGAVAIKLSALPLLVIAIVYFAWQNYQNFKIVLIGGAITLILLLPVIIAGYQTSGCIFYPASSFCFDVSWSLPLAETQTFERETTSLENWFGTPPSDRIAFIWLLERWFKSRNTNRLMTFLMLLSVGCIITIFKNRFKLSAGYFWIVIVAIFGSIFIFLQGPLIRFALGYLLLSPAVALSIIFRSFRNTIGKIGQRLIVSINSPRLFWLTLGFVVSFYLSYPNLFKQWLIPPIPPQTFLVAKEAENFTYFIPVENGCWAAKLPCNSNDSSDWDSIKLRNPELGLKGGFLRN